MYQHQQRSGNVQSDTQELHSPVVVCLCYVTLAEWYLGEIASCQATIAEATSLVERLASDLIELSTRENFALWLAVGAMLRGWARSALDDTTEGISLIEDGIGDYQAIRGLPHFLALKAEALHLAGRRASKLPTRRCFVVGVISRNGSALRPTSSAGVVMCDAIKRTTPSGPACGLPNSPSLAIARKGAETNLLQTKRIESIEAFYGKEFVATSWRR
jgi:hypothetical protein